MDKRQTALERMKELGAIEFREWEKGVDITVPHSMGVTQGIEFGFLLAQLSEHEYPEGFGSLSSSPDSKVYGKPVWGVAPPVHFVESYPHGMKYRVYKKGIKR